MWEEEDDDEDEEEDDDEDDEEEETQMVGSVFTVETVLALSFWTGR